MRDVFPHPTSPTITTLKSSLLLVCPLLTPGTLSGIPLRTQTRMWVEKQTSFLSKLTSTGQNRNTIQRYPESQDTELSPLLAFVPSTTSTRVNRTPLSPVVPVLSCKKVAHPRLFSSHTDRYLLTLPAPPASLCTLRIFPRSYAYKRNAMTLQ